MIIVNKGNFFAYTVIKSLNSTSAPKSTFYSGFKVCIVLEGEAFWEIEEQVYQVKKGDVIFLNMGEKRQFTAFGKNGFKLCAFSLNRNAFVGQHHFLFFLERIKKKGNVIRNNTLAPLLEEISKEWAANSPIRYELASAKLTEWFLKVEREEGCELQPMSENRLRMLETMDYIDANILNVSLSDVAKRSGLTESALSRQFSSINGISFKQYLVEKKIQRAILLLQTTNRKMIDIALESGFDSISGFYSAFKKTTGTTPGKFYEFDI